MKTISIHSDPPVESVEFSTLDEAIAYALHEAPDGCVVAIHDDECEISEDDEDTCTCTPLELTTGAKS